MIYSLHTTGLKAASSCTEETGANQSPNQAVKQKLYRDTRENKSSTFHSFRINLPSLLCGDVLLLSAPCFRAGLAPANPTEMLEGDPEQPAPAELLYWAPGFLFAVRSQAQLFSASPDSGSSRASALSLSILCA